MFYMLFAEFSEKLHPSICQKLAEKEFMFFQRKLSKSSEFYYLEPGLYPFITDNAEAINTFIQEQHIYSKNCITIRVSRRMQKVEIYLEM